MNTVGIDVPSRKSTVAALRSLGEVVQLPLDVVRNAGGLASLTERLTAKPALCWNTHRSS